MTFSQITGFFPLLAFVAILVTLTFSTGGFYRKIPQPKLCYDLVPQKDGVLQADCRKLPIKSGSARSIIIDPPFLATTGKSLQSNNVNIINRRFSVARSERELAALYEAAIGEANRVLCPGGILVFKCQDKVSSGKQHMMHCNVYQWAILQGFEVLDLFILLARSRLVANWQRNQKHARKYHCYFWVFKKRREVVPNVTKIAHQRARTSCSCSLWYEGEEKKAAKITLARKGRKG